MELSRLKQILAVAETGSFTRAAQALNLTQPALSRSIASFERRHAVRLFDRGRAGAQLTPSGQFVVERARALLQAGDELERDIGLFSKGAAGRVAAGIGPMLASLLVPRIADHMLGGSTGLQISTLIRPPDLLLPDLLDGRIEMIVGNSLLLAETPGIEIEPILSLQLGIAVRRDHPLAQQPSVTMADLRLYPAARPVRASGPYQASGAVICDNMDALSQTVMRSDCTWLVSPALIEGDLAADRLTMLNMPDIHTMTNEVGIITQSARTLSPAARSLIDAVRATLKEVSASTAGQS